MESKSLLVKGKDAKDFLHRILASDVKVLQEGEGNRGLLLDGQSKMIAQFDVLCLEEGSYLLVSPSECFMSMEGALEKMHFAEDLVFQRGDSFYLSKNEASEGAQKFSFDLKEALCWPSAVSGYIFSEKAGDIRDFAFQRIGSLIPFPEKDWDKNTFALEAGTLPWIDRNKGCYPGQEVVEKSLNLGHPARILIAVESDKEFIEGSLLSEWGATVLSVAARDHVFRAILRVPWKNRALPGLKVIRTHFPVP